MRKCIICGELLEESNTINHLISHEKVYKLSHLGLILTYYIEDTKVI